MSVSLFSNNFLSINQSIQYEEFSIETFEKILVNNKINDDILEILYDIKKDFPNKENIKEITSFKIRKDLLYKIIIKKLVSDSNKHKVFYFYLLKSFISPLTVIESIIYESIDELSRESLSNKSVLEKLNSLKKFVSEANKLCHIRKDNINLVSYIKNELEIEEIAFLNKNLQPNHELEGMKRRDKKQRRSHINIDKWKSTVNSLSSSIYGTNINAYSQIFQNSFDIFEFYETNKDLSMLIITQACLGFYNLCDKYFTYETLCYFISKIRTSYQNNPYHNQLHAMDVLQTTFLYMKKLDFDSYFDEYDVLSIIISSLAHDLDHPGKNNSYQINKQTELAITYNDQSVLENHHLSKLFNILLDKKANIFINIDRQTYKRMRKRMIDIILSTDMTIHLKVVQKVESMIKNIKTNDLNASVDSTNQNLFENLLSNENKKFEVEQSLCNFIVHVADISNPSKNTSIYEKWANRITEEFFNQGDSEREEGLSVSFFCDRSTVNVRKSQLGFIDNFVLPSFEIMVSFGDSFIELKENVIENKRKLIWNC